MQLKAALPLKTKRWLNAIQHDIISAEGDAQRLRHERRLWMSLADEDWLLSASAGDDDAAATAREMKEGDEKLCCECCGAPVGIDGVSCSMGELDALQGAAGGGSAARQCNSDADSEEGCVEDTAAKGKAMMQRIIDEFHQHARNALIRTRSTEGLEKVALNAEGEKAASGDGDGATDDAEGDAGADGGDRGGDLCVR